MTRETENLLRQQINVYLDALFDTYRGEKLHAAQKSGIVQRACGDFIERTHKNEPMFKRSA